MIGILMADVIAMSGRWNNHCCVCNFYGRCYCLGGLDVMATRVVVVLADGIAWSALL